MVLNAAVECMYGENPCLMIVPTCHENTNVGVESKDSDVLVLMIRAFTIHFPAN